MNEQSRNKIVAQGMTGLLMKGLVSLSASLAVLGAAGAAEAALFVDYWGDNLFLGLAYHRVGCLTNDVTIVSNQDYDGFTSTRFCFDGQPWNAPGNAGHTYLGSNGTSGAAQLNACGTQANNKYGTPNYAARSNTCSYNVLTNCNSDCWIREFSRCQGMQIAIASPCL
ncbi:hypothetical protein ACMHYB_37835 [Sorangium sp. So ce1128]